LERRSDILDSNSDTKRNGKSHLDNCFGKLFCHIYNLCGSKVSKKMMMTCSPYKALQMTANPLRGLSAAELGR
jgi:hypothetical protein